MKVYLAISIKDVRLPLLHSPRLGSGQPVNTVVPTTMPTAAPTAAPTATCAVRAVVRAGVSAATRTGIPNAVSDAISTTALLWQVPIWMFLTLKGRFLSKIRRKLFASIACLAQVHLLHLVQLPVHTPVR